MHVMRSAPAGFISPLLSPRLEEHVAFDACTDQILQPSRWDMNETFTVSQRLRSQQSLKHHCERLMRSFSLSKKVDDPSTTTFLNENGDDTQEPSLRRLKHKILSLFRQINTNKDDLPSSRTTSANEDDNTITEGDELKSSEGTELLLNKISPYTISHENEEQKPFVIGTVLSNKNGIDNDTSSKWIDNIILEDIPLETGSETLSSKASPINDFASIDPKTGSFVLLRSASSNTPCNESEILPTITYDRSLLLRPEENLETNYLLQQVALIKTQDLHHPLINGSSSSHFFSGLKKWWKHMRSGIQQIEHSTTTTFHNTSETFHQMMKQASFVSDVYTIKNLGLCISDEYLPGDQLISNRCGIGKYTSQKTPVNMTSNNLIITNKKKEKKKEKKSQFKLSCTWCSNQWNQQHNLNTLHNIDDANNDHTVYKYSMSSNLKENHFDDSLLIKPIGSFATRRYSHILPSIPDILYEKKHSDCTTVGSNNDLEIDEHDIGTPRLCDSIGYIEERDKQSEKESGHPLHLSSIDGSDTWDTITTHQLRASYAVVQLNNSKTSRDQLKWLDSLLRVLNVRSNRLDSQDPTRLSAIEGHAIETCLRLIHEATIISLKKKNTPGNMMETLFPKKMNESLLHHSMSTYMGSDELFLTNLSLLLLQELCLNTVATEQFKNKNGPMIIIERIQSMGLFLVNTDNHSNNNDKNMELIPSVVNDNDLENFLKNAQVHARVDPCPIEIECLKSVYRLLFSTCIGHHDTSEFWIEAGLIQFPMYTLTIKNPNSTYMKDVVYVGLALGVLRVLGNREKIQQEQLHQFSLLAIRKLQEYPQDYWISENALAIISLAQSRNPQITLQLNIRQDLNVWKLLIDRCRMLQNENHVLFQGLSAIKEACSRDSNIVQKMKYDGLLELIDSVLPNKSDNYIKYLLPIIIPLKHILENNETLLNSIKYGITNTHKQYDQTPILPYMEQDNEDKDMTEHLNASIFSETSNEQKNDVLGWIPPMDQFTKQHSKQSDILHNNIIESLGHHVHDSPSFFIIENNSPRYHLKENMTHFLPESLSSCENVDTPECIECNIQQECNPSSLNTGVDNFSSLNTIHCSLPTIQAYTDETDNNDITKTCLLETLRKITLPGENKEDSSEGSSGNSGRKNKKNRKRRNRKTRSKKDKTSSDGSAGSDTVSSPLM